MSKFSRLLPWFVCVVISVAAITIVSVRNDKQAVPSVASQPTCITPAPADFSASNLKAYQELFNFERVQMMADLFGYITNTGYRGANEPSPKKLELHQPFSLNVGESVQINSSTITVESVQPATDLKSALAKILIDGHEYTVTAVSLDPTSSFISLSTYTLEGNYVRVRLMSVYHFPGNGLSGMWMFAEEYAG